MNTKPRDFYHVQDQLELSWMFISGANGARGRELNSISAQIEELEKSMGPQVEEVNHYIQLARKKISLLENILGTAHPGKGAAGSSDNVNRASVEVSLSSSGMGFFSPDPADDDAKIEITLFLDTTQIQLRLIATVLESRLSADPEKPGYWIRVRFSQNQETGIDQLLAHVTQRQIERIKRKTETQNNKI